MEMLNSFSVLLANNFWTNIINFFAKSVVNYGWAIILFTICLKLVLTPLDITQRFASQKQSKVMGKMQPEMDAIQKKYAGNKERINKEQSKLYSKYKTNMGGMCIIMLVYLVLTLVVTFTLYGSLRSYGDEKLNTSFKQIDTAYVQVEQGLDSGLSQAEKDEILSQTVIEEYEKVSKNNSWLWVKNVWKADTSTSQFVNFDDYAKYYRLNETEKTNAKTRYDFITSTIKAEYGDTNGYFILIVLAIGVSFLTQFISSKLLAPKGQKLNTTNKIMMAIIPLTMLILVTTSNVVYTLYVITNSVLAALISTAVSLIMRKKPGSNDEDIVIKKKKVEVVEYSRNYNK